MGRPMPARSGKPWTNRSYVFLVHTDLLGQRLLLYNTPVYFYRLDYQGAWQSCYPSEECKEGSCVWVDDMGNCSAGSGWDCYYASRCTIRSGEPTNYTMAIENVNQNPRVLPFVRLSPVISGRPLFRRPWFRPIPARVPGY